MLTKSLRMRLQEKGLDAEAAAEFELVLRIKSGQKIYAITSASRL